MSERMKLYVIEYETTDGKKGRVTARGYSLRDAVLSALDHEAGSNGLPANLKRMEVV